MSTMYKLLHFALQGGETDPPHLVWVLSFLTLNGSASLPPLSLSPSSSFYDGESSPCGKRGENGCLVYEEEEETGVGLCIICPLYEPIPFLDRNLPAFSLGTRYFPFPTF
jgi:hypothetical protein